MFALHFKFHKPLFEPFGIIDGASLFGILWNYFLGELLKCTFLTRLFLSKLCLKIGALFFRHLSDSWCKDLHFNGTVRNLVLLGLYFLRFLSRGSLIFGFFIFLVCIFLLGFLLLSRGFSTSLLRSVKLQSSPMLGMKLYF
jgi:hypothetical protein